MKLKNLLLTLLLAAPMVANADESEEKKVTLKPYGFVRTDFYYNSRDCVSGVNDVFNLYPMDIDLDANGEDLNAYSSSGFFAFVSRLGLDIKGSLGKATASGKIEIDFGGYSNMNTLLRIRQAYIDFDWKSGNSVLIGQTWHPLFGEVSPMMVNLSTGAPYQPFSRTPQVRYEYKSESGFKFIAAALWQLQYLSNGPDGKSIEYQANSCIPEFYTGVDLYSGNWLVGVGANVLNISPRQESTVDDLTYKVDELMTAVSAEFHLRYKDDKLYFALKSIYASALDNTTMLGGYAVTSIDSVTGEQTYTPLHNSTTWLNIAYGKRWIPSIFVGYTKNLGATKDVYTDAMYGSGLDIDQLVSGSFSLWYKLPHWSFGIEYTAQTAWYGEEYSSKGKVLNTHDVTNHRVTSQISFIF